MRTGLTLEGLTKTYPTPDGTSRFVVMQDFTLTLEPGEFVCLVGHSGCGKSTALSIAAGLNTADAGHVTVNGAVVDGPGLDRGVVFQAPCLLPWLSALDNVRLGIDQAKPKLAKKERVALAMRYLEKVGLGDAAHVRPSELSQGMQQRVGIARAFALAPRVLLLDEPFGMLDSLTRVELQEVLLHLWRAERTTALMVTHDVDEALQATHMLFGMPIASTMGLLGSPKKPMVIPWMLNRNGQAITLKKALQGQGRRRSEGAEAARRRGEGRGDAADLRDDVPAGHARDVDALLARRRRHQSRQGRLAHHHPAAADGRQHEGRQDGRLLRRRAVERARHRRRHRLHRDHDAGRSGRTIPRRSAPSPRSSPRRIPKTVKAVLKALHEASVWLDELENRPEQCDDRRRARRTSTARRRSSSAACWATTTTATAARSRTRTT